MDKTKPEIEIETAAQLYTGGKSVVEVAAAMDITYGKARKLILLSNTELRDPSKRLVGRTRPEKTKEQS